MILIVGTVSPSAVWYNSYTQRRNDLARLSTAITQYQTNNNGRLPGKQDGVNVTCKPQNSTYGALIDTTNSTNEACKFIASYMHSANANKDDESEFVDPTGEPYKLEIAAYNKGTIGDKKQTLTNDDYNNEQTGKTVYLTTNSRCGENETVVGTNNKRDYSILYKLEGSGVYCKDNGS